MLSYFNAILLCKYDLLKYSNTNKVISNQLHSVFKSEQVRLNIFLKLFVHFACLEIVSRKQVDKHILWSLSLNILLVLCSIKNKGMLLIPYIRSNKE